MNVGSLFSGIGGLDLGLERAGMHVAWHSEIDQPACRVLEHHWPEVPNLGDITRVRAGHLQPVADGGRVNDSYGHGGKHDATRVDLLCGGFPCQDLSVAGRRAGLSGQQSGLFYEFARLADELRPAWLIIENVPGLLSSNDGRDMGTLLNALADLGYADLSWRVVDSLNFGVPQRRRRLFIVAHLGTGTRTRQVLLEPEGRPWSPPQGRETRTPAANDAARSVEYGCGGAARSLKASGGFKSDDTHETYVPVGFHFGSDPGAYEGHASTLTGRNGDPGAVAFSENGRAEVVETAYSHAMTSGGGKPGEGYPAARIGARVRRLTPLECERLQGFPDHWTHPAGSDSARYRCLGNAVTVPVAHWIGQQIMAEERGQL